MNSKAVLTAFAILAALTPGGASVAETRPPVAVFKTPLCGCCEAWTAALRDTGYQVQINDLDDLTRVKELAGVPAPLETCHTAVIGDTKKYVLEGHVPLAAIDKLTAEHPDIRGKAVPGMPQGSLGMGQGASDDYAVYAFAVGDLAGPKVLFQPAN